MNFLAHSFLAFSDEQIVGQFLQDFIKNKERFSFPVGIQEGIRMHREIDTFTDAHPEIHRAKKIFSPLVRLYAGAFVDVAFDHFLALSMPESVLWKHSQKVYNVLRNHENFLPEKLLRMLDYMEKDNWLFHYREDSGIEFSMRNVLNRAQYLEQDVQIFAVFLDNKSNLQQHFNLFFPDLLKHAIQMNEDFGRNLK